MRLVLTEPEQITRYAVDHFYEATESEISAAEHEIKRNRRGNVEPHLLYALRVSKCVPKVTTFKTLASRWRVANEGPRITSGIGAAGGSPNQLLVFDFLTNLYVQRFFGLCKQLANKTVDSVDKRKTPAAKLKVFENAIERIHAGAAEFDPEPRGLHKIVKDWTNYLKSLAKHIG